MKRKELLVQPGGLYRCCLATIVEWMDEAPEADAVEGETFTCRYEKTAIEPAKMIVHQGTVRWYDPDYPPLP
jgi:hypothetical protein